MEIVSWKMGGAITTFLSLVVLEVVVTTTSSNTSDNKVGIKTKLALWWFSAFHVCIFVISFPTKTSFYENSSAFEDLFFRQNPCVSVTQHDSCRCPGFCEPPDEQDRSVLWYDLGWVHANRGVKKYNLFGKAMSLWPILCWCMRSSS